MHDTEEMLRLIHCQLIPRRMYQKILRRMYQKILRRMYQSMMMLILKVVELKVTTIRELHEEFATNTSHTRRRSSGAASARMASVLVTMTAPVINIAKNCDPSVCLCVCV